MIARAISRLLRWIDRRDAVATVRQFARCRGLTPIEVATELPPGARIAWLVVSVEEAQ